MELSDRTSGFTTWMLRASVLVMMLIGLRHGYYKLFDHSASGAADEPAAQELDPKGVGLANIVTRDRVALRSAHGAAQNAAAMTQLAADQAKAVAWSRFYSPAPECAKGELADMEAECKERYRRAAQDFDNQYRSSR